MAAADDGRHLLGLSTLSRDGDRGGRHVHFALLVSRERLEGICDELRGQGIEVEGPIEHEGGDRSIYVSDPEGNRVELWDFFRNGERVGDLADG